MKILHIEPLEHYRTGFRAAVSRTKYEIAAETGCGDEAIAHMAEIDPDLIVMCVVAPLRVSEPGGGGVRLIDEILKKDPKALIVVTHTVDTRYLVMKAIKSGAVSRMSKPFSRERTLEALAQAESGAGGGQSVRRAKTRMKSSLVVWYKKLSEGFLRRMRSSITTDLSASGMSIRATEPLPERTMLKLKIEVPGEKNRIEAQAKVMRCRPLADLSLYEIGLAFTEMQKADRNVIEKYILKSISKSQ